MAPPDKRAGGSKKKKAVPRKAGDSQDKSREKPESKKWSNKGPASWKNSAKKRSSKDGYKAGGKKQPWNSDDKKESWKSRSKKSSWKSGGKKFSGKGKPAWGARSDRDEKAWPESKREGRTRGDKPWAENKRDGRGRDERPWSEGKRDGKGRGDKPWSKDKRSGGGRDYKGRGDRDRQDRSRDEHIPAPTDPSHLPQLVATCALGLELTVGRELEALGLGPIKRDNAQVAFPFTPEAVAKSNYWLRTADRVWLQLAEFPARDFEELFQGVKAIDWPSMLPQDAEFPVEVITTKSKLESESACQAVSKKAAVERMQEVYGRSQFPETGPRFAIRVFLVYNQARVFIDTSGEGLHRRGYRTYNAKAPLRETVAAALVLLSHWSVERELYDPMCGSGTILLEAASIGLKKAAGLERSFASQRWRFLGRECWEQTHQEALDLYDRRTQLKIYGSDNDSQVLKLARTHLAQADLEGRGVYFQARELADFSSQRKYGVVITNPPYGRRLGSEEEVEELTRTMAQIFEPLADTWSLYYYTGYERFAEVYGRQPERVRKIYNGRIQANLLQYPGPKPPNSGSQDGSGGTSERVKRIPLSP